MFKLHVYLIVKTVVAATTLHSDPLSRFALKCQSANQLTASFLRFRDVCLSVRALKHTSSLQM